MAFWFHSRSPEATRKAAASLAAQIDVCEAGFAVGLTGPLGAGKTAFVQGLGAGFGLEAVTISSPTFVIANEYGLSPDSNGRVRRMAHVDLYRVESADEIEGFGFWDFLVRGTLVVVEWSDRFPEVLPRDHLELRLLREAEPEGDSVRRIEVRATGPRSEAVLQAWREELSEQPGIDEVRDL